MLRISTTTLESFRYFINSKFDDYDKESEATQNFINQLKGDYTPNEFMLKGTAFHAIIESPNTTLTIDKNKQYYSFNNYNFSLNCILKSHYQVYSELDKQIIFNEIKSTKIYNVNNYEIELVAKVDVVSGNKIIENKTAWTLFGKNGLKVFYDNYFNSLQWKIYLDIFEAQTCKYNIFLLSDKDTPEIELQQIYSFEFDKSQYNQNEILDNLQEFTNWLETKNLIYLFNKESK